MRAPSSGSAGAAAGAGHRSRDGDGVAVREFVPEWPFRRTWLTELLSDGLYGTNSREEVAAEAYENV